MPTSQPVVVAVLTFIVGMAICVFIFAALDVQMIFLVGPAIAVGAGAYAAYRTASIQ
jgi:hypothetical protein